MGLQNTIEELKVQLEEEKKKEQEIQEDIPAAEEEVVEQEQVQEEEPVLEKVEEKKEEVKVEEEKLDNSAYARMRREKAAAEKRAQELEARLQALESAKVQDSPAQMQEEVRAFEPDPVLTEIVQTHRQIQAEKEFKALEDRFRQDNPNYDAVASEYALALAQSIKLQNPRLTSAEIAERTKNTILLKAADYLNRGFDPIQELYHDARDLGFTGRREEQAKPEKELKPDLKKVAANKSRSSGMAAASGTSEGTLTPSAAINMTVAEWAKVPHSEKVKVFGQLAKSI